MSPCCLAVDIGASSGRTILGTLAEGKLTLEEVNRFWNGPTEIHGVLYWDVLHLFRHIRQGIDAARSTRGDELISIGVDTWGVDFGLLDEQGQLLAQPVHYRDSRTNGVMDRVCNEIGRQTIFAQTGIQFLPFNTLYQLAAMRQSGAASYRMANRLLFIPDLLNYWLTGEMACERTIASTSQMLNPTTGEWALELLDQAGLRMDWFAPLADPGTVLGQHEDTPVVLVGSHDTASAFAAVPVEEGESCAFLSSGTWSLLGTELDTPIISEAACAANLTNEAGVCGSIRFLKNLSGLWVIQELRRVWQEQGIDYGWRDMDRLAQESTPFAAFVDPSDELFLAPGDMATRIQEYCDRTGQRRLGTHGEIIRTAYEGLALLYADAYQVIEKLSDRRLDVLRIVGGGCQNALLNQFAANAVNRRVVSGPIEATALGNLLVQLMAMGKVESLAAGRALIRRSFANEMQEFPPQDSAAWEDALGQWRQVRERSK